jgi:hypothetical protein
MKNKNQSTCMWLHVKIEFGFSAYISSSSPLFRAFLAMHWKASSTLIPSLAEVSKYGIFPFDAHQARAFFSETWKINKNTHVVFEYKRYQHHKSVRVRGKKKEDDNLKEIHTTLLFPPSISTLFPRTTNGKFSGSEGLACIRFLISLPQVQTFTFI